MLCDGAQMATFCVLYFQRATCSTVSDLHPKFALRPHHVEGSVHKGSISRNPNFSGNEFLCFASFTSSFYQHALAIVYWFLHH